MVADSVVLLGLFQDAEHTAEALDELRRLGIAEHDITVLSGVPYPSQVLGRPEVQERMPIISLTGALAGLLTGIFLSVGTPLLYTVQVGGHPIISIPPSAVIIYELTMMGLIISTFLGVLWQSFLPSYGPTYYDPLLASGRIGILLRCPVDQEEDVRKTLRAVGAEQVQKGERRPL